LKIDFAALVSLKIVPTAPMPASGFIMLVPAEEVTELDWSPEQTLQVLISVGLTAPPEVPYFRIGPASEMSLTAVRAAGEVPRTDRTNVNLTRPEPEDLDERL
jgi:hypothetical protein